jgi:hypothetical protein
MIICFVRDAESQASLTVDNVKLSQETSADVIYSVESRQDSTVNVAA